MYVTLLNMPCPWFWLALVNSSGMAPLRLTVATGTAPTQRSRTDRGAVADGSGKVARIEVGLRGAVVWDRWVVRRLSNRGALRKPSRPHVGAATSRSSRSVAHGGLDLVADLFVDVL